MTHLLILCEGDTEKRVLEFFLRPYWKTRFHTVEVLKYGGNGELSREFKFAAETQLTQDSESSVLCLIDLFEQPFRFYKSEQMTIEEGFKTIQDHMYRQIKSRFHPRFGAFPVVMEIETWLLADPVIQNYLEQTILEPETIQHPAAFLKTVYSARNNHYDKIVDGTRLFGKADAGRVFDDNCPHFNKLAEWIINPPAIPIAISETLTAATENWEKQLDEKYRYWLNLEKEAKTDSDLEEAINAEVDFKSFLSTYSQIFHQSE